MLFRSEVDGLGADGGPDVLPAGHLDHPLARPGEPGADLVPHPGGFGGDEDRGHGGEATAHGAGRAHPRPGSPAEQQRRHLVERIHVVHVPAQERDERDRGPRAEAQLHPLELLPLAGGDLLEVRERVEPIREILA